MSRLSSAWIGASTTIRSRIPKAHIVVDEAAQQALERVGGEDDGKPHPDDGPDDDRERPPHPAVVALLVIDRREPTDRPLQAEQADRRADRDDREGQRERAVLGPS